MNEVEIGFEALEKCMINQRQGRYKWKSTKTRKSLCDK